jgi:pyruvate dehydrogenase E2 component (dihydrolipoamide acetyltransferase)
MSLRAFTMPKWGIEMVEGVLGEWKVAEGAAFAAGDLLALIETDKITNEVEADAPGVLARRVAAEGERLPVGALLAVLSDGPADPAAVQAFIAAWRPAEGSEAARWAVPGDAAGPAAAPAASAAEAAPAPPPIPPGLTLSPAARAYAQAHGLDVAAIAGSGRGGRISLQDLVQASRPEARPALVGPLPLPEEAGPPATPLARRLAAQHGLSLEGVMGTGSRGRIGRADVEALIAARDAPGGAAAAPAPAAAPPAGAAGPAVSGTPRVERMTSLQRAAARRLAQAKATIPHFYLRTEAALDELERLRAAANLVSGRKASLTDCLLRAAALALVRTPGVNVQVHGEEIHHFPHADIALAVATGRGLVAPVLRGVDRLGVHAIAEATAALAGRARAGRLAPGELEGATFTLSNLGMFGIDQFDAIINPPAAAILAVGAARRVFAEAPGGGGAFRAQVALSLSCDHRAIDGATGARFLAALRALIEAPAELFAPAG